MIERLRARPEWKFFGILVRADRTLRWQATRMRERPVVWSLLLVLAANIVVFWSMASAAADGALALDRLESAFHQGRGLFGV